MFNIFSIIWSWVKQLYTAVIEKLGFGEAEPGDSGDPGTVDPFPERPEPGPGEVVCYYGCPNSKKAQKLQLQKKLYR